MSMARYNEVDTKHRKGIAFGFRTRAVLSARFDQGETRKKKNSRQRTRVYQKIGFCNRHMRLAVRKGHEFVLDTHRSTWAKGRVVVATNDARDKLLSRIQYIPQIHAV